MNARRKIIIEGIKQAGMVAGALLACCLVAWLLAMAFLHSTKNDNGLTGNFCAVSGLVAIITGCILTGPVPTLVTFFDITNQQVLILSCGLIIPYWLFLGALIGYLRSTPPVEAAPISKQEKKHTRWAIECLALALALVFSPYSPVGFNRVFLTSDEHMSKANAIINNLRIIDAAKQQFALEKKIPMNYTPTEADLIPYLGRRGGQLPHVGPERYVLNPIAETPYAILDKDWRIRRQGFREGYTITNGTSYHLSN